MAPIRVSSVSCLAFVVTWLSACAIAPGAAPPEVRQALAPSGKLRVGIYPGSPTSLIVDPVSGEAKGMGRELGQHLARKLGVPFEAVEFPGNAGVLDAVKRGEVDFAFTNATASRAKDMDFTQAVLDIEQGYLVPAGSAIATAADVDRPGVKVGVSAGSTSQAVLSRELRQASVVPVPDLKTGARMLLAGEVSAYATNKAILAEMARAVPGSRMLEGRWGMESLAVGIPKGREAGMAWLRGFVDEARTDGAITRALERAGLRGIAQPAP